MMKERVSSWGCETASTTVNIVMSFSGVNSMTNGSVDGGSGQSRLTGYTCTRDYWRQRHV